MAAAAPDDPMCCHFAIARNLASKQLSPGVEARDKLLLDAIEEKQEKIFKKDGLAATDKGKKELKSVLKLVREEVENYNQHGFGGLRIFTKNGGVIGGIICIGDGDYCGFSFNVDKKKNKKKMAITVERHDASMSSVVTQKETPISNRLANAYDKQGAQSFAFSVPLLCTSCHPGLKEARYQHFNSRNQCNEVRNQLYCSMRLKPNQVSGQALEARQFPYLLV